PDHPQRRQPQPPPPGARLEHLLAAGAPDDLVAAGPAPGAGPDGLRPPAVPDRRTQPGRSPHAALSPETRRPAAPPQRRGPCPPTAGAAQPSRNEVGFARNEVFSSSPGRRRLKAAINGGLSLLGVGDALKAWAIRGPGS